MTFYYKDYLSFELPNHWCTEEDNENLLIYNPEGEGAIVISFLSVLESEKTLDEHLSIMAKKFIDQNGITLHASLILYTDKEAKTMLHGTGITSDDWFIKLWIVAKHPKIVFVTYQCEKKTSEVKKCDAIIGSMKFLF